jgi:hypothetical protein
MKTHLAEKVKPQFSNLILIVYKVAVKQSTNYVIKENIHLEFS